MDAEALDVAQRARDGAVRHRPHQHVHALGHQRDEIPERVVRRRRLREAAIRLHLHGVDQVGKLDGVLDEEHRDVVADQVEVAFVGIELHGEAAHVARRVDRARAAGHRREAREDLGPLARILQERRLAVSSRHVLERLEIAVRRRAARMHDALGNALMVEMGDLLAQDEILQQRRAARAALQRILVVGDRRALIGGQSLGRRMSSSGASSPPATASFLLRLFRFLGFFTERLQPPATGGATGSAARRKISISGKPSRALFSRSLHANEPCGD